ncbi:MAG: hypothetical protein IH947_05480 [Bacteroidetes bacterium]|nr:hypothetical protein [Bacteroidota bacterium]MCH8232231.1 hypothetical protein [Bacteroidota bacterium]
MILNVFTNVILGKNLAILESFINKINGKHQEILLDLHRTYYNIGNKYDCENNKSLLFQFSIHSSVGGDYYTAWPKNGNKNTGTCNIGRVESSVNHNHVFYCLELITACIRT